MSAPSHENPPPEQSQEYPGRTSEMDPQPRDEMRDYDGRALLAGKRALITGGDSGIGRAVAVAFTKEGTEADAASAQFFWSVPRGRGTAILRLVDRPAGALPEPGTTLLSPGGPAVQVIGPALGSLRAGNCPPRAVSGSTPTGHIYEKSL